MTYADLRALETLQLREKYYYEEVVPSLTVGRVFFEICARLLWCNVSK